jgi:signal transduction histidine kinase
MGSTPTKTWTILAVDDDADILAGLKSFFKDHGWNTQDFTDPEAAFEWGKKNPFDILIADLKLPKFSGLALHEKLQFYYPDLITILVTAYYSFDSAQEAVASRIYAYLSKPFKLQEIANLVQMALEKKELLDRNRQLVDEQQQLIEKLLFMNKELKQLSRLKSDFVSNVSHELRTPLTSLKTVLYNLLHGIAGEMTPKQKEYFEMMEEDVVRLERLISDMLDLSHLDSGKTPFKPEPFLLKEVIEAALRLFEGKTQRDMKFIREYQGDIEALEILGERDKIERVLVNLINNAVKYSGDGKRVWIRVKPEETKVTVSVKDEGIGISAEDQEKIFDRFEQLEKMARGATEGAGLGLAIVKEVLERHGTEVRVESAPHHGSTFSFELPIHRQRVE